METTCICNIGGVACLDSALKVNFIGEPENCITQMTLQKTDKVGNYKKKTKWSNNAIGFRGMLSIQISVQD